MALNKAGRAAVGLKFANRLQDVYTIKGWQPVTNDARAVRVQIPPRATVTFYNRRPTTLNNDVVDIQLFVDGDKLRYDVGHTFIRLDNGWGNVQYVGHYASEFSITDNILRKNDTRGERRNDRDADWHVGRIYHITNAQYQQIQDFIDNYDFSTYNITDKNCTTFAVDALAVAGIESPTRKHDWTIGETNIGTLYSPGISIPFYFYGYSPAGAARHMQGALDTPYIEKTDDGYRTLVREALPWWMRRYLTNGRPVSTYRVREIEQ